MAVTQVLTLPRTICHEGRLKPKTVNQHRKSHSESIHVEIGESLYLQSHTGKQSVDSRHDVEQIDSILSPQRQSSHFVNSPYLGIEHQLDLNSLDIQSRLLAQALTTLAPATSSFATTIYQESLNWFDVFNKLRDLTGEYGHRFTKQDFYVVEFRSKLKPDINKSLLFKLDKESHREATASGGLLKYWFGEPNFERQNLATCLWRSKADAIDGGKGPWHKKARGIIPQMYEKIEIRGLKLSIEENVSDWKFEPWSQ